MFVVLFSLELILILAIAAFTSAGNKELPTAYAVKENTEETDFKLFTKAVCEEKSGYIFCHDELFAVCKNKEYLVGRNGQDNFTLTECGIKSNLSNAKVNGSAKFKKENFSIQKPILV